jgi:hypothetical protein
MIDVDTFPPFVSHSSENALREGAENLMREHIFGYRKNA